jgi:Zn-dependent peptidase ImmA (M78 family)/DNA-binding XRE family transcriptional regulator
MFNSRRLSLARRRRGLTGKKLAEIAGLSPITVSRIENGDTPDDTTIDSLAKALKYPRDFFFGDDPEEVDTEAVSFRSLSKMSARERDAAVAAGALGLQVSDWLEREFSLPVPNLIDLSYETDMEAAARLLRQHWGLGEKPIGNMLGLLEVQGVRVFSMSEETASVDAFSFWRDGKPYMFLNTFKSAEHSIFDAAHELCHLVAHQHANPQRSPIAEREANAFASAFLMPVADVRSWMTGFITVDEVIKAKKRWRISAMALAYRLHALGLLTDWRYKSACIELGRRGYRSAERDGIERETSAIWRKVLTQLWSERMTKEDIARTLNLPGDEIENLIWGLTSSTTRPDRDEAGDLYLIK